MKALYIGLHIAMVLLGLAIIILAMTGLVVPVGTHPAAIPPQSVWSGVILVVFTLFRIITMEYL